MRWLVLTVAVTGLCGAAQAREPLARPMEHTPYIMVGGEMEKPSRATRQKAARPRASRTRRTQASRARPLIIPRPSTIYETETRSINSSISHQQQQLQIQQRRQRAHRGARTRMIMVGRAELHLLHFAEMPDRAVS